MLGASINHFAYPYGDYNESHVEMVKKAGYSSAATTIPRVNTVKANSYKIGRLDAPKGINTLILQISGIWHAMGFDALKMDYLRSRGIPF